MRRTVLTALALSFVVPGAAPAAPAVESPARPWMNRSLSTEARVKLLLAAMREDEKRQLLFGYWPDKLPDVPDAVLTAAERKAYLARAIPGSAGYVPGVARLGIPEQFETDASHGVRNPNLGRTSLPSSLATAASWDPAITEAGGRMIGSEARASGFNVMLAGGINLAREPRNGRNFEYAGEDPLLASEVVAGLIRGVQSNHIVSTIKHFALNAQETGRHGANAQISESGARASDYLAFELAIEKSSPGSVMCAYNRVGELYACENPALLTGMLKQDWGYRGYVMSDWGAVYTVRAANAGLDQESGYPFDKAPYFKQPLKDAIDDGAVSNARLDDMVGRILWALFDKGVIDNPPASGSIDFAAHAKVTQAAAEASMVLLRNEGDLLPLTRQKRLAMIGSFADAGVLAGGGSSLVTPRGGNAVPGLEPAIWPGPQIWHPSSPVAALRALRPDADIRYDSGFNIARAVEAAKASDVAIVFVHQWLGEDFDAATLSLSGNQDALVGAVAAANPNTVVVVESGGPVFMPWASQVKAILQAWYPGTEGGTAIARVLTGDVNPSGRLPITFPASADQFVRPVIDGKGKGDREPFLVRYSEGAAVGYKWFDLKGLKPLYAFGHGLGYTSFDYSGLTAAAQGSGIRVRFTLTNTGKRAGATVGQIYVAPVSGGWEAPRRLGGFAKLSLAAGATGTASVDIDRRLLATFDEVTRDWVIAPGRYEIQLGAASDDIRGRVTVTLPGQRFSVLDGKSSPG